jgi:hypothetical protein
MAAACLGILVLVRRAQEGFDSLVALWSMSKWDSRRRSEGLLVGHARAERSRGIEGARMKMRREHRCSRCAAGESCLTAAWLAVNSDTQPCQLDAPQSSL